MRGVYGRWASGLGWKGGLLGCEQQLPSKFLLAKSGQLPAGSHAAPASNPLHTHDTTLICTYTQHVRTPHPYTRLLLRSKLFKEYSMAVPLDNLARVLAGHVLPHLWGKQAASAAGAFGQAGGWLRQALGGWDCGGCMSWWQMG